MENVPEYYRCTKCGGDMRTGDYANRQYDEAGREYHPLCYVQVLEEELADIQGTFDIIQDANMRAIRRWQEAHPDKHMMWPDKTELTLWLLNELEDYTKLNAALNNTKAVAEMEAVKQHQMKITAALAKVSVDDLGHKTLRAWDDAPIGSVLKDFAPDERMVIMSERDFDEYVLHIPHIK